MTVRVRDLPDSTRDAKGNQIFLWCQECGQEYSPQRGDYFAMAPDDVMYCENEDHRLGLSEPLRLMRRVTRLVHVSKSEVTV